MIGLSEALIQSILQKREYRDLPPAVAREASEKYFRQHPLLRKRLEGKSLRSALFQQVVKAVRGELRRGYGLFRSSLNLAEWQERVLQAGSKKELAGLAQAILAHHPATKGRLAYYRLWEEQLLAMIGSTTSILDISCGLHPLYLAFSKLKKVRYLAYDLSKTELTFLNLFFRRLRELKPGIQGTAAVLDIRQVEALRQLPLSEVCFLFQMTDIIDQGKGHKRSELIIQAIPANVVVVSFPTVTMSGRPMNFPRRRWIEWMCQRLGYSYQMFSLPNEIFYVVGKPAASVSLPSGISKP